MDLNPIGDWAHVFGPASLSNLGPGFDTLGLCVSELGDVVRVRTVEQPGVHVTSITGDGGTLSKATAQNTAATAALYVLRQANAVHGLEMTIEKGVRPGSGIGSSAASAVAGAWAANEALGSSFAKAEVVEAVLRGEAVASGSLHGDNVLPALFGGLLLVSATEPTRYRCVQLPRDLHLAVILPQVQVLTKEAREMLPDQVSLWDAVHNTSELAFMLDAFHAGDWETIGQSMMQDRLVEPVRATLVPCYPMVKTAALEAGALGCALTGSGPAMYALAESAAHAEVVLQAMLEASRCSGTPADGLATTVDAEGTRCVAPDWKRVRLVDAVL
ncbi:MAG: homoserine kinase [Rhodothermales bacterium]